MNTEDILAGLKAAKTQKNKALIKATLEHIENSHKAICGLVAQRNKWKAECQALLKLIGKINQDAEIREAAMKKQNETNYLQ